MFPAGTCRRPSPRNPSAKICAIAGLTRPALAAAKCLLVEETGTGPDHPFSGEKLAPVLTVYRADNFDRAFDTLRDIYAYMGNGHSCGIYSENDAHIRRLGLEMTVCCVIVKQAHTFATGGSFDEAGCRSRCRWAAARGAATAFRKTCTTSISSTSRASCARYPRANRVPTISLARIGKSTKSKVTSSAKDSQGR